MDYKEETKRAYNFYATAFDQKFDDYFQSRVKTEADLFISKLPKGATLLDLGSGPGNHGLYFQQQGLRVLCADISEEMLRLCRAKGLEAVHTDIEAMEFRPQTFDAVWSYASLLHIPKVKIPSVVQKLYDIVKPGGFLGLAVKEGEGEGFEVNEKYPDTQRWFTYFTDEEVKNLFTPSFTVAYENKINVKNKYTFLHYILHKQ
jgi:ubiquinone/menaquinone biosynthesis C-methylase UbiE